MAPSVPSPAVKILRQKDLRLRPFVTLADLVVGAGLAVQAVSIGLAIWARRHLGRNWSGAVAVAVDQAYRRETWALIAGLF